MPHPRFEELHSNVIKSCVPGKCDLCQKEEGTVGCSDDLGYSFVFR